MLVDIQKLRNLAYNRQLVSNNRIILPEQISTLDSYRVLEKPLYELITNDLKESSWTVDELAVKYGISKEDIREPLTIAMRDPAFIAEGFLPRRVGRVKRNGKGRNVQYAFIPIPIEARIFDITLGLSLLHFDALIKQHAHQLHFLSNKEALADFQEAVSGCWNIRKDKVHEYMNKYDVDCILSSIGPLLILKEEGIYERIRNKLFEEENLLAPRFNRRDIGEIIENIQQTFVEGFIDITDVHNTIIELSDLTRYCKYRNLIQEYKKLNKISEDAFCSLFIQCPETILKPVLETEMMVNEVRSIPKEPARSIILNKEDSTRTCMEVSEYPMGENVAEIYKVIKLEPVKLSEQQSALRDLKNHLDEPCAFDLAVHCLTTSKNTNILKESIKILSLLKDERAIEPLTVAYGKVGFYLSIEIVRAFGSIGSSKALPLLYEVLNSKHLDQRIAAIIALGKIKDPQVTSKLIHQFKDPKIEIKKSVVRALGENSDTRAVPALIDIFKYSNSTIRVEAIRALVKLDPTLALPYVQEACNDGSKIVREEAERLLYIIIDR